MAEDNNITQQGDTATTPTTDLASALGADPSTLTPQQQQEIASKIALIPLPPEVMNMVSQCRGAFLAQSSTIFDKSVEPLLQAMKGLMLKNSDLEGLADTASTASAAPATPPKPNRAQRRAQARSKAHAQSRSTKKNSKSARSSPGKRSP